MSIFEHLWGRREGDGWVKVRPDGTRVDFKHRRAKMLVRRRTAAEILAVFFLGGALVLTAYLALTGWIPLDG